MSNLFLQRLPQISTLMFDVDGVLTDGTVIANDSGEQLRTFHTKDGYALQLAVKLGYRICIITGSKSPGVIKRLQGLGITDIFAAVQDKLSQFDQYILDHKLDPMEILYMGDDIPDLGIMKKSGLPCCPADAVNEIKEVSLYVSGIPGGRGCVREIIEKVMKLQGKWTLEDRQNLVW